MDSDAVLYCWQKSMSTWELLKFSWSMKGCLWAIVIRVNSQISGTIWLAYFLKSTIQTYCLGLGISGMLSGLKEHDHLSFYTSPLLYPIKVHDKELHRYFLLEFIRYYDG